MLRNLFRRNKKVEEVTQEELERKFKLVLEKFGLEDTPQNRQKAVCMMMNYQRDKYIEKEINKKTAIYGTLLNIFIR